MAVRQRISRSLCLVPLELGRPKKEKNGCFEIRSRKEGYGDLEEKEIHGND